MEGAVEIAESLCQRVYGASVFEVADEGDVQVVQTALCLADRIKVEEALGRMLVGSVSCVDDRYFGHFGSVAGTAFPGMAHDNQVGVIAYHQNGVFQGFPLGHAAVRCIREADDPSSELVGCALETETGSGGGFKEQGGNDFVGQNPLAGILCEFFRHIQQVQLLFLAEVGNRDQVFILHKAEILGLMRFGMNFLWEKRFWQKKSDSLRNRQK